MYQDTLLYVCIRIDNPGQQQIGEKNYHNISRHCKKHLSRQLVLLLLSLTGEISKYYATLCIEINKSVRHFIGTTRIYRLLRYMYWYLLNCFSTDSCYRPGIIKTAQCNLSIKTCLWTITNCSL